MSAQQPLSNRYQTWYRFSRNPTAVIGLLIVITCVMLAALAPWITPYPDHVGAVVDFRNRHQPPSAAHWFGTDNVGRDIFTRVIFGFRVSLQLAFVVLIIAVPFGTVMGLLAGYYGGWVEVVIMRMTDIALAIPPLVMALAVAAVLEPSLMNAMLAISALWWTWHTRMIFSLTRQIRAQEFVEAAETLGASKFHILFREILPNCVSAIAVKTSLDAGFVILIGAASVVPWAGHPSTHTGPWHHGGTRGLVPAGHVVAIHAARIGDLVRGAGVQPSGRRVARSLRCGGCAMSLLSVEGLRVSFTTYGRRTEVLHGVSLEVSEGAQVALVGESGSGKSVTMKAIMGILAQPPARIEDGRILFDGRDLLTMPERERLRLRGTAMSMVFQDPMSSLNPVWTVADQLTTILKYADRRLGRSRNNRARMDRVHRGSGTGAYART
jgi:peptide/nickel transport system permease protein